MVYIKIHFHLCKGVKVTVKGEEITCRARLLFTLADLPAKASLTNMIQYNGKFGCHTCKQEGEQVYTCIHICLHLHFGDNIHKGLMRAKV